MYDLRCYNPRMSGNVYRITRKCGKTNCRCAHSKRNWHPSWILDYTERIKGKRVRRHEYVPRAKVKALRQRIRRAKVKDHQRREKIQLLLTETPKLLRRLQEDPFDLPAAIDEKNFPIVFDSDGAAGLCLIQLPEPVCPICADMGAIEEVPGAGEKDGIAPIHDHVPPTKGVQKLIPLVEFPLY